MDLPKEKEEARITVPVKDPTPGQVAVVVNKDGTETIVPRSVVTESGVSLTARDGQTIKIIDNSKDYDDVAGVPWAQDAVDFVSARELFTGTGERTFSPNTQMTRGMLVTVLHRLEGTPRATMEALFDDIEEGKYYTEAALWASEKKIVAGTDKGFEPEGLITREQFAVLLYRYAGSPAVEETPVEGFVDASYVSDWAVAAMNWAVASGIITGRGSGILDPGANASRAEVATMLQRFVTKF